MYTIAVTCATIYQWYIQVLQHSVTWCQRQCSLITTQSDKTTCVHMLQHDVTCRIMMWHVTWIHVCMYVSSDVVLHTLIFIQYECTCYVKVDWTLVLVCYNDVPTYAHSLACNECCCKMLSTSSFNLARVIKSWIFTYTVGQYQLCTCAEIESFCLSLKT